MSNINIKVTLDNESVPEKIEWNATDHGQAFSECKGMLISLFDLESRDTLKIDLWTKEMQVAEMDRFMFQTLRALSDTYFKATQNSALANDMTKFAQYFGEKTEILKPEE
jgi:gliding motility-associated protein GldC